MSQLREDHEHAKVELRQEVVDLEGFIRTSLAERGIVLPPRPVILHVSATGEKCKTPSGGSDGSVPVGKPTDNCYKVILESSSQMRFAMSTAWSSSVTARVALIVPSSAWAG